MVRSLVCCSLLAGFLSIGASSLLAGLEWKTTLVEVEAKLGDENAKAVYEFKNSGSTPITIKNIQTSCGCTSASDARGTYQPGQSGKIEVDFQFQGRKGQQQKTIIIETPEQEPALQVLSFKVKIPQDIVLSEESVAWTKGAAPEAKTVEVNLLNPKVKLTKLASTNANFEAKFEEIEAGKHLRITVKPISTEQELSAVVRLDFAEPGGRAMFLPVRVKN